MADEELIHDAGAFKIVKTYDVIFEPAHDISAYELAIVIRDYFKRSRVSRDEYSKLPAAIMRHFRLIVPVDESS